jgi:lipopolysaccharide heptosyltransferase I
VVPIPAERILLIRPSALGDVCRTVPVLASLRAAYPNARIDWLVQDAFVDAVRAHPALSNAVPFPRESLGAAGPVSQLRWMRETLRPPGYDLVIDAQGLLRSGIFSRWTGARTRVGHADAREGATVFYTRRVRTDAVHTVDRMLSLLGAIGVDPVIDMRLHADAGELAAVDADERVLGAVVLAPTSRWAAKRWPDERWAVLAERLLANGVERIVVVGGPGEQAQCARTLALAERDPRVVSLVGTTSVARLMAVIARARLVVANDSAAVHMAVGFDRPTVALFGPTDTRKVGPYRREADVLQHLRDGDAFDHKRDAGVEMMERIGVDEVAEACAVRL